MDGKTEYRTDILPEPAPHDAAFIVAADHAWVDHLTQVLGRYKAVGDCYDGPASSAKPGWEQGFKDQQRYNSKTVRDDWRYDE